jgi:aryl sulfotransferase
LEDIHEFFAWSMNDSQMWFKHVASFWEHFGEVNVLFVHYNDMQADLEGEMRRVAAFLDIDVAEARWPRAVERCTFTSMKLRADEIGDFESHFIGGAESFLYKGTNGRWQDVLTSDELALFDQRCQELLTPPAVEWTTFGRSAFSH